MIVPQYVSMKSMDGPSMIFHVTCKECIHPIDQLAHITWVIVYIYIYTHNII